MFDGISDICVMCGSKESSNHLFIHREIASSVWSQVFSRYEWLGALRSLSPSFWSLEESSILWVWSNPLEDCPVCYYVVVVERKE